MGQESPRTCAAAVDNGRLVTCFARTLLNAPIPSLHVQHMRRAPRRMEGTSVATVRRDITSQHQRPRNAYQMFAIPLESRLLTLTGLSRILALASSEMNASMLAILASNRTGAMSVDQTVNSLAQCVWGQSARTMSQFYIPTVVTIILAFRQQARRVGTYATMDTHQLVLTYACQQVISWVADAT